MRAGLELLEKDGIDGLSLRKCAAKAGVSHAAPAHHFGNLAGLKSAIGIEVFTIFSKYMLEASQREGESDIARLKGICRGYVQFGIDHKPWLDMMFGVAPIEVAKLRGDLGDSNAYQVLRDACAPFIPIGTAPNIVEFQVWSLVHGYTQLFLSGRLNQGTVAQIDDGPFDQVMSMLDLLASS
ncbi:TetR/AcrR family transcriptional regulator [Cognatishimia sp. WU-CL00825]|uniref:TetR/AcrR family transcriptional regulator n=1 Tax=Cognatishimia sp. WU-CL00825 TaxID=3127658 RepID=UPI00336552C5